MKRKSEAAFWLVAIGAAVLYGFMHAAPYGPSFFSGQTQIETAELLFHAVMETYGWLPGFAAGLILARRAVLLSFVIILLGQVFSSVFRDLFAPTLIIDDWDRAVVNWVELGLAIAGVAVAATGGQFLSRQRLNRTTEPAR